MEGQERKIDTPKHNSSRSIYKADTCYREGNGFSPAGSTTKIGTSIKFEANGKMTKYGSGDCTGAGVATNDGSGACGGKFKVARAAIPVGLYTFAKKVDPQLESAWFQPLSLPLDPS